MTVAKIQDVDIPHLEFGEAAAPGTPASGIVRLYAKTDGLLYSKDDAGAETAVSGGGGSASPTIARQNDDDEADVSVAANGTSTLASIASVVLGADDVLVVFAQCSMRTSTTSAVASTLRIKRDSTTLNEKRVHNHGSSALRAYPALVYFDKPGAGTYTYSAELSNDAGSAAAMVASMIEFQITTLSF